MTDRVGYKVLNAVSPQEGIAAFRGRRAPVMR